MPPPYAATGFGTELDANAKRSGDGKTLVLQVVNSSSQTVPAELHLAGFIPSNPVAQVADLSRPMDAVNVHETPDAIAPQQHDWQHVRTAVTHSRRIRLQ